MNLALLPSLYRAAAVALLCVVLLGAPAAAPAAEVPAACAAAPAPVLVARSSWNSFWNLVEGNLNSRAALLRFGTVGMFIALFIIMRNKW